MSVLEMESFEHGDGQKTDREVSTHTTAGVRDFQQMTVSRTGTATASDLTSRVV